MSIPFAENLAYEDLIKRTGIPFGPLIPIGVVQGKFKERHLTRINNAPRYQGLYIWWAAFEGQYIPFYAGMSDDQNGIRSRIKREIYYSQNEGSAMPRLSGPLRALSMFKKLGYEDVSLYITTARYVGKKRIVAKEKHMLNRVDFAANEQNNGSGRHMGAFRNTLIKLALLADEEEYDLDSIDECPVDEEEHDWDSMDDFIESEDENESESDGEEYTDRVRPDKIFNLGFHARMRA